VGQTGDFSKPVLQIGDHAGVAEVLVGWGEGMRIGDGGPTKRGKFRGGVEFHGAGTERNHGMGEGEVLGGEAADVTEELVLIPVGGKDRVLKGGGGASQGAGEQR